MLSPYSLFWSELDEKNRSGQLEVYERVPADKPISRSRGVVCLIYFYLQHYAKLDKHSEEYILMLQVGDLLVLTEREIVKSLNKHLDERGSTEGGFFHVSRVVARLDHLRKKGKAQKFQEDLESFAGQYGFSFEAFNQWQAVMDCKAARDRSAHPVKKCVIESLQDALAKDAEALTPCKDAVAAMLAFARRLDLT